MRIRIVAGRQAPVTVPCNASVVVGHWRVTGSPLQLFAHRDGIALIFTVEDDTPSYRNAWDELRHVKWNRGRPQPTRR